ncbi:MAG TPA: GntR family transcriptional regulator [Arachidicoccus sp.]|nr:GntR family transcriptional regulator [Arachidicoccus sp.]
MLLEIDHNSPLPLHIQVEALLRKMLNSVEYKDGSMLPKEVELSNRLGVSRNTIRQATNKLELEGLLIRKKGVGSRAAPKKPLYTGLDHWYSFTQEMRERGLNVINLELDVRMVAADKKLASFFNIEKGRKVLKLAKLKGTSGQPIVYFESYFHPRIGVNEKDDFDIPLYTMLEREYGVVVVRSLENISALAAGKWAQKLEIDEKEAVLVRERFVFDAGDRPIEYNVGYYRSDRFIYSIDIKKA